MNGVLGVAAKRGSASCSAPALPISRRCLPVLMLATVLGLAACAGPALRPPDSTLLTGRMALQVGAHGDQGSRGFSGQFELRGSAQSGSLELSSPLGTTVAQVAWKPGRYRLGDDKRFIEYASLDDLVAASLGEPLPLAALFDWLRARPWADAPHQPRKDGLPGFEQLGWRIDTSEAAAGNLRAQRDTPPSLNLRIRLDRPA